MDKNEKPGFLNIDTSLYQTRLSDKFLKRKPYKPADPKIILSFIPGTVLEIYTAAGKEVKKGEVLMILDAMKMQNRLKSAIDGKVIRICVSNGDKVSKGAVILEIG